MAEDTTRGRFVIHDEFDMDNINTSAANGVRWLVSSDTGNTAFAVGANRGMTTAQGATDTTDDDMVEIGHGLLAWHAQDGEMWMEARIQFDVVTTLAFTVGFNDDALEDSNTLPVELSGTTFTSNAATFVGMVFDVDATTDEVHAFWVDDDNDTGEAIADLNMRGFAPTAAQWATYRVHVQDRGSGLGARVTFSIVDHNGTLYQRVFNTTIDRDVLLTPHVAFENHGAAAHVCDLDYIEVGKSRAS